MNKWRLLLLSIFALLHITTSERIFIDGRNECCDDSRHPPSGNRLSAYDSYRHSRYSHEVRNLNNPDKNLITDGPHSDISAVSRRTLSEHREQRLNNRVSQDDSRRVITRHRTRLLSSIPEIVRVRVSRERINEYTNELSIGLRDDRSSRQLDGQYQRDARLTTSTDYRLKRLSGTRFEVRKDQRLDNIRDSRDIRIAQQTTKRNNNFNDIAERKVLREESGSRNLRKTNERTNVIDTRHVGYERNSRLTMREEERRKQPRERNVEEKTKMTTLRSNTWSYEKNRRISSTTRIPLQRNNEVVLNENRERTIRTVIRDTRDNTLVSHRTQQVQTYSNKKSLERTVRTSKVRSRVVHENDKLTRFEGRQMNRGSSNSVRNSQSLERLSRASNIKVSTNGREQDIPKRSLSEDRSITRDARIERRRNIDTRKSKQYLERSSILEFRANFETKRDDRERHKSNLNENRYSEDRNLQRNTRNRLEMQRDTLERTSTRDNRITESRQNLQENALRIELRRSLRNRRILNEATLRITRRAGEILNISPETRDRRTLIESRQVSLRERREIEQSDRVNARRDTNNRRLFDESHRNRFENEYRLRVRQEQNRISLRIRVSDEERTIESGRLVDNERRLISGRSDNERLSRRQNVRNVYEQTRITKNTEGRRIDERRIITNTERRFRSELANNEGSIQMAIEQTDIFEVKWQYLFYLVQALYLCTLLMRIPKDNETTKHKFRYTNWLLPKGLIKND